MPKKKTCDLEQPLLEALRRNIQVLNELALRYQIDTQRVPAPDCLPNLSSPEAVRQLVQQEMAGLVQEQLRVLLLDIRNGLRGQTVVYQGNVNSSVARPAEILRPAVIEACPGIILVHNHPSGDPTPSPEDVSITKQIIDAGRLLDIQVLDHVVIGREAVVSMKERGLIQSWS